MSDIAYDGEFWFYDTWHRELDPAILEILAEICGKRRGGEWVYVESGPSHHDGWTSHTFARKEGT